MCFTECKYFPRLNSVCVYSMIMVCSYDMPQRATLAHSAIAMAGARTVASSCHVENIDSVFNQAVAAGSKSVMYCRATPLCFGVDPLLFNLSTQSFRS